MKISIVTICFNNEADIRPTIESVVQQTYPNIEYILVDGASKDNTLGIIREYADKINTIISEPDKGLYDAINKGIKAATGDVVGLIHAGDRLYDHTTISKIAEKFSNHDVDATYGHSMIVKEGDLPVRINRSPPFKKSLCKVGWMPSHQSIYIKRDLFKELGYYNLDLHPSSDYEFFLRYFYFNDIKVMLVDEFILKFAVGGRSTKSYINNLKAQKQHIACWKVNGVNPPLYLIPLKLLRKVSQFARAWLYKNKFISYATK